MARPSVLVRLSTRRHDGRAPETNGNVKPVTRENSWRRRSPASLSRRISPDPKPVAPPSAVDPDDSQATSDSVLPTTYERPVELIRQEKYPHMNQGTYLDHSGATIYARSAVERFGKKMLTGLYGNPHSANEPAKISGDMVDAVREKALRFLGADPRHFDLVFTANVTGAIKLVADAFRDLAEQTRAGSFWYGYHRDAHTSLVGVRELTSPHDQHIFHSDAEVEAWLSNPSSSPVTHTRLSTLGLFAYPGQSNLTGRRLPLDWSLKLRTSSSSASSPSTHMCDTYTLLDTAALAMTSSLAPVFADPAAAPDFVCVSFYKIFGFPDLGGLVVRRESGHILALRKYFGGGTVELVSTIGGAWHVSKGLVASGHGHGSGEGGEDGGGRGVLHEGLEDGTLPFHSILALGEAVDVHGELFGGMENVGVHTTALVVRLYRGMVGLRHANGQRLCKVYEEGDGDENGVGVGFGDARRQGATVAFNVFRADGGYESYATVERLANERGVYVRSGGICCPGGVFTALQYEPWQLDRARSAGHHCGPNGLGVIHELPTGVVRASLGAMSTAQDVDTFLTFLCETFIKQEGPAGCGSVQECAGEHEYAPQVEARPPS